MQEVTAKIKEAQEEVIAKAQSAKIFLDLAEPKRLSRAVDIVKKGVVQITKETPEGVEGLCEPSGEGEPYRVAFRVRAFRVRGATCTCPEGMCGETCKHVMALCVKWMLIQKTNWAKLNAALKILDDPR